MPKPTGSEVRPGVASYYFPPPGWAQMAPYVSEAFSGFMGLLESRAQGQFSIGAGIRTIEPLFPLFEKLINVAHRKAPQAKLCFNSAPEDTAEAVQRWV